MRLMKRVAILALLVLGCGAVTTSSALAACLPGQTCWQPSQPGVETLRRQTQQDRSQWLQDQQRLNNDRLRLQMPLGTPSASETLRQQQDLRHAQEQLWQSQQNLQRSQQQLLDAQRPPLPKP